MALKEFDVDVRLLDRHLQTGVIGKKEFESHLKSLPDDQKRATTVDLVQLEAELEAERDSLDSHEDEITLSLDEYVATEEEFPA